jgi:hypothetical protein
MMLETSVEHPSETFAGTIERIRAEFMEMPGLALTVEQAARLWSLDMTFCRAVLGALEESRFLVRTRHCTFARPGNV